MAYHHYAPAHIAVRLANWVTGVCGALVTITGIYVHLFDLPRLVPFGIVMTGFLATIVLAVAIPRAMRRANPPRLASRGYLLAGIAAIVSVGSIIAAAVPLSADIGAYIPAAAAQAILAAAAALSWWRAEPAVLTEGR